MHDTCTVVHYSALSMALWSITLHSLPTGLPKAHLNGLRWAELSVWLTACVSYGVCSTFYHPNIVQLLGVVVHGMPKMVVLEYVDGGDLLTHMQTYRQVRHRSILWCSCKETARRQQLYNGNHENKSNRQVNTLIVQCAAVIRIYRKQMGTRESKTNLRCALCCDTVLQNRDTLFSFPISFR